MGTIKNCSQQEGVKMEKFITAFGKNHRPEIDELDSFWSKEISNLFHMFSDYIMEKHNLRFSLPVWSETNGWTYRIGRSGVYLFSNMIMFQDGFKMEEIKVVDQLSYDKLILHIDKLYPELKENFEAEIDAKNKKQKERNKVRIEREHREKEELQSRIVPERYNKFHWPAKLNLTVLRQLYLSDAKGICNEELADEVGLTLFLRCKYGKSDMDLMNQYAIRCHNCGEIIYGATDFRECKCGQQYSYKEYRRNYRRNNMPTGAAAKVFNQYIIDWPNAKTYQDKIILIDRLLHEFHLSLVSGTVNRPVAMNFIDGSRQKVQDIITELSL